jgi:hypothetical protein
MLFLETRQARIFCDQHDQSRTFPTVMAVSHDPNTPPMVPSFDNILEYFTSLARFPSEEVETRFWRIADFDHKDPQEAHTKQEKCCANMSYHGPFDSQEAGRALVPVTPPSSSGHSPEADHHASTGVKLSEKVGKRHMKGHSKSRRGCFDCKRRKIKARNSSKQQFCILTIHSARKHDHNVSIVLD